MTREEAKIKDMTNAFIDRLVSIEREYWLAHEMEKSDYNVEIKVKKDAIDAEIIVFKENYDLSDLFVDMIYKIAVNEFKLFD